MTDLSDRTTMQNEAFAEAAQQARKFSRLKRALVWAVVPFVLLVIEIPHRLQPRVVTFWTFLLMVPVVVLFIWTGVEFARQGNSYRKLRAVITSEHTGTRHNVSPVVIGPLLEVALSESAECEFLVASAGLLVDLLNSVQEGDNVVLTVKQRQLLHKLLLHGRRP